MLIRAIKTKLETLGAVFSIPTGQRTSITSKSITLTLPDRNSTKHFYKEVTYRATATDVFMELNGVPHRLFVDVDADFFGEGMKHIWLTDGGSRTIEGNTLNVRMFDTIPSSNCAIWECEICGEKWVSPSKLPCSKCSGASSESGDSTEASIVSH